MISSSLPQFFVYMREQRYEEVKYLRTIEIKFRCIDFRIVFQFSRNHLQLGVLVKTLYFLCLIKLSKIAKII